jgi:hypothetical protein
VSAWKAPLSPSKMEKGAGGIGAVLPKAASSF